MECDKCNGTGRLDDERKPPISYCWLSYENPITGFPERYQAETQEEVIKFCNRMKLKPAGFKDFSGKKNWLCLGIVRAGSGATVDTKYIYKIDGRWYSSGHPKVWEMPKCTK